MYLDVLEDGFVLSFTNYWHSPINDNAKLSSNCTNFYAGINILHILTPSIKIFKNDKALFKAALRKYLHTHCFYAVNEFFMCKDDL